MNLKPIVIELEVENWEVVNARCKNKTILDLIVIVFLATVFEDLNQQVFIEHVRYH